jgi:hypothetical protein
VSPDDRSLAAIVDRALLRARVLAVAEATLCGAAGAAAAPAAGALVAALVLVLRLRFWTRSAIVRALERATPASRNLLITADELWRGQLQARESVRAHVFADVSAIAGSVNTARAVPARPLAACAALAAVAWAIALGAGRFGATAPALTANGTSMRAADGTNPAKSMTLTVTTHPPPYTGLADTHAVDPAELRGIEGSVALLTIETAASRVTVEHDGAIKTLTPDSAGRVTDRLPLTKTGYIAIESDRGDRRTLPVVVTPDALPTVRLSAPGRDLVFADGRASILNPGAPAPRIGFTARATDDYGLQSLSLRYTKVSGSGEEYQFTEGDIPLTVTRTNPRDWSGTASRTLADLGLKEGDMLVYRAVASDARPGDGSASSDAFFIEISRLGVAAGDAFTLPEQETRYALSQQMLIVKTDRLVKARASMPVEQFTEASLNLAVEQRMIRAEFVFMLGGEISDEDVEAEQSVELQAGRLANRGQSDLRAATIAMSQAEKLLTAANPSDALVAERNAVAALQRAFARDRYILRASPTRVDLDPKRRLTGDLSAAASWSRAIPDTPANRRTAQLQDLLLGLTELAAAPDRSRALVLAGTALRIDASSESLRKAATGLQRGGGVDEAIAAVAEETKRSLFAAPAPSIDVAPGLRRALTERAR